MDIFFDEVWLVSWHLKKEKSIRPFPEDQFERSRGLQCDMLTCLMSERSDKQYSHKCSKGPTLSLPDISPSHLIDKHFSGAYTLILLPDIGWQVCGLWPNAKQPFKPSSVWGCSRMTWMIYQTNSEVMVTVIKHKGAHTSACTVLSGENSSIHSCIQWAIYLEGSL